jgi:hypothetical protein
VRRAIDLGYVVGSASDRTVGFQQRMWDQQGIVVDFVGHKHHLADIMSRFDCDRHVHIGDTEVDQHYAKMAGVEFHFVDEVPESGTKGWIF